MSWDASYTFNEMANMNYLLVWMHGNNNGNPCYIDGIRVATTWAEAVGEEIVGPPSVSPTNTVYAGTPIVLSAAAAVNATSGEFQWMLSDQYPGRERRHLYQRQPRRGGLGTLQRHLPE